MFIIHSSSIPPKGVSMENLGLTERPKVALINLQYIVVTLTLLYIIIYAYIKIKYPFWNNQPVYHTYDFWRAFYSEPFFIYKYRPIKTKFSNDVNVKTIPYLDATSDQKRQVLQLLQSNYISNDRILLTLSEKDLDALYGGHFDTPFISLYIEKNYRLEENLGKLDNSNNETIILNKRIIGSIVSNPVHVYLAPGSRPSNVYTETPLYYTDFLCVNRELNPTKKIKHIRELFDTHEYNQRIYNPAIAGSLFKREIDLLDGIVPIVQYITYVYYLRTFLRCTPESWSGSASSLNMGFPPLPAHFHVVHINAENLDLLTDFLYVQTHLDLDKSAHLDLLSVTSLGNYIAMIKQGLCHVFCLRKGEHIFATYFFRDGKMQYEDLDGDTLQFYGSMSNTDTAHLFYLGLLHSLYQIMKKYPRFKMLMFENLGDNSVLHTLWRQKNSPIFENKTAYYSFNWICPGSPLRSEKCLFL